MIVPARDRRSRGVVWSASAGAALVCVTLAVAGCAIPAQLPSGAPVSTTVAAADPSGRPATTLDGAAAGDLPAFVGNGLSPSGRGAFGLDRIHIQAPEPGVGAVLRVDYPRGSASSRSAAAEGSSYGGAQMYLRLPHSSVEQLHLRYYVRFPAGFDFVKGGKLPGLYGGTAVSGGHTPDGTDGLSTRFMWRRGGAGEVYAYLPSSVGYGTSLGRGSWSFTPGRWTSIEQAVQLNTPGRSDGSVTVWLDGRQVFQQTAITYRTTDSLKIDGVFFSTFFGGGDPSWASPTDQHTDFAAFALSDTYIGPVPGIGS